MFKLRSDYKTSSISAISNYNMLIITINIKLKKRIYKREKSIIKQKALICKYYTEEFNNAVSKYFKYSRYIEDFCKAFNIIGKASLTICNDTNHSSYEYSKDHPLLMLQVRNKLLF